MPDVHQDEDEPPPLQRGAGADVHQCVLELHAIAMKKAEGGGDFAVAMTAGKNSGSLTASLRISVRIIACWVL